tara:strand:- start:253 stop:765 length:513 start_codon:yes stop_codon:yes gene_type:complete
MNLNKYLLVFILLLNTNAYSDEKVTIRYIDLDFILKNSSIGKKLIKSSLEERNKKIKQNEKIEKNLANKKEDIVSKKNILSKEEFEKKVIFHQEEVKKYRIKRNEEFKEMKKNDLNKTSKFLKEIDKILLDYSKENKIDLVLKRDALIISNSNVDITKKILTIVDENIKN